MGAMNFFKHFLGDDWGVHPDDRKLTAFTIQNVGQLQWTVVPMGLRNSTQTQQRVMEQLLMGIDPRHVLAYIDDVIIAKQLPLPGVVAG